MKKQILLWIVAIMAITPLSAQSDMDEGKSAWIDLQIGQQIGLNNWSDVGYINDGLPAASITELRGVLNILIHKRVVGVFGDIALGIMPAPDMKSFDLSRMPVPVNGTQYYLREMLSESGATGASVHFKFTGGLFGDIRATEKLHIMPYLGVGGLTLSERSYEMILKEEGSNMQYNTIYAWRGETDESYDSSSYMLGYLSCRLNFKYQINPKSNLLFGLEYTHFLNTINFYGRYSNTFNGNVRKNFMTEGNKLNMLGITVGISFR
jgi:hypothetical protein